MRSSVPADRPRHGRLSRAVAQALLAALFAAPPGLPARAEISGEQVVSGTASFDRQGDAVTIQAGDRAIIEYDAFNVWTHESLRFVQPHAQATVLNRVRERPHIEGVLDANGIVYIVSPAGIFFGSEAVVNVGGLVAAAGDIANDDFRAGIDRFALSGEVLQAGRIEAGTVALLGRSVANHGRIRAPEGTIALVAGSRALLTRLGGHLHVEVEGPADDAMAPAIEHTGTLDAGSGSVSFVTGDVYSLALNHEGITRGRDIALHAASGTALVSGRLDASDRRDGGVGGSIEVTGERVALVGAELDASGDAGGGEIRVGGDRGGRGELANARRSFVDAASRLRADAVSRGDGGRVIVWADEVSAFHGALSARGGDASGDGGFAEISGAQRLYADGSVDLRAPNGETGTLLYDPQDIRIVGGSADGSDSPDPDANRLEGASLGQVLFADLGDGAVPFLIYESEIEGTNANVVLQAQHSITSSGSFDHDSGLGEGPGVVRLQDSRSLTLATRNDPGDETGSPEAAGIDLAGVSFQTRGGAISFTTGDGDIAVGDLTTRGADAASGGAGSAVTLAAGGSGSLSAGAIDSAGGAGSTGAGGAGGAVSLTSEDGSIDVASVVTSGGAGATSGGRAGTVRAVVSGSGNLALGDAATPAVIARGGAGPTGGGSGPLSTLPEQFGVVLRTADGDIASGAIDTRGGDAAAVGTALGGNGGDVLIQSGFVEGGGGDVRLLGNIDADEGASGDAASQIALIGRDGGEVALGAAGDLEHGGQAGPHVRTTSHVTLEAVGDVGATGTFVIEGSGERRLDAFDRPSDHDGLFVIAGGTADVEVTNPDRAFLLSIHVTATDPGASLSVRQAGAGGLDEVTMAGSGGEMVVTRADAASSGNEIDLAVILDNRDDAAPDATLRLAEGSVRAGRAFTAFSDGDLVLDDGATPVIVAGATRAPGQDASSPRIARAVDLRADVDADGSGAILDAPGGGSAQIDMFGSSDDRPGTLTLRAAEGIGTAGEPITVTGGGTLDAANRPRMADPEDPDRSVPDPASTGGIFVRNVAHATADGGWQIQSAIVDAGAGDIELSNEAGDLSLRGRIATRPTDPDDGAGGDLHLVVGDPASQRILLDTSLGLAAGGAQIYDGDVALVRDASLVAGTGVVVNGAVDSDAAAPLEADLAARIDEGGIFAVRDGLGAQRPLSSFELEAADADGDLSLDALVLDTPFIEASADASFGPVGLAQDLFVATPDALFAGDVDSAAGTPSSLALLTDVVEFQGDVGSASPLVGLDVASPLVLFGGAGDQSVTTGAGGLGLGSGGPPLPVANIAKQTGGLRLESSGAVAIGDGDKLSVPGALTLVGSSVRVTDLSALDVDVQAPAIAIFARAPGSVLLPGGALVRDGGTDLIANTIAFSSAPSVVGSGPAPRLATPSGAAQNAGALRVLPLPAALVAANISLPSGEVLDLAIPTVDPGLETPEDPTRVEVPGMLLASDAEADLGPEPSAAQVLAYLSCAPLAGETPPSGCATPPAVRGGSHLDTPRAPELARAWRELLGDSAWARAGRRAVADTARTPRPDWRPASLDPDARRYLLELARVLARARMLRLDEGYPQLRDALLRELAQAIGAPLDAPTLAAAAEANGMGLPI